MPPLFSIIIPTYNRLPLLKWALQSVWDQTFSDFEVIVVDDGSTDGTAAYLATLSDRVRLVEQSNKGPGGARNLGAKSALGEYLAFLDSDDLWFPWTLQSFVEIISRYDRPAVISSKLIHFTQPTRLDSLQTSAVEGEFFKDHFASSKRPYFVGAGMLAVRRDCFLRAGGFVDGRMNLEDHDLILRLGTDDGFVQIMQPATLAVRQHDESETRLTQQSITGSLFLIENEKRNAYPGGSRRATERQRIIARHVRPIALACLRTHRIKDGWKLYREIVFWQLKLHRWKFVLLFPVLTAVAWARSKPAAQNEQETVSI